MPKEYLLSNCSQEINAIYVLPLVYVNYGYILKKFDCALSSNTYTFINKRKSNIEMFIAPFSRRRQLSVYFMTYNEYCKKNLSKYEKPRVYEIKKSNTYHGLICDNKYDLHP